MKYQVGSIENALRSGAKSISHAVIMAGYPLNGYTQKLGRIAAENCKKQRSNIADYTKACIIDAIRKETSDNFVSVKDVLLRLRLSLGGGNHRTVAEVVDELGIRRQKDSYSKRSRKQKDQPVSTEPVAVNFEEAAASSDGFAIWERYISAKNDFEVAKASFAAYLESKAKYDAARAEVLDLLELPRGD